MDAIDSQGATLVLLRVRGEDGLSPDEARRWPAPTGWPLASPSCGPRATTSRRSAPRSSGKPRSPSTSCASRGPSRPTRAGRRAN